MKNRFILIVLCFALVGAQVACADMIVVNPSAAKTIEIDISTSPEYEQGYVSVAIMPYDDGTIEAGTIPNTFYFTDEVDANGRLVKTITLPDSFACGQYRVMYHEGDREWVSRIGIVDATYTADALQAVNAATDVAGMKAALQTLAGFPVHAGTLEQYGHTICDYLLKHRPQAGGYTTDALIREYFVAEAVGRFTAPVREKISAQQLLTEYDAYLTRGAYAGYRGTFGTLPETMLDEVDRLLTHHIQTDSEIEEGFVEAYEVARVKAVSDWDDLETIYIPEASARGVDMTEYDKLTTQDDRESVMLKLQSKMKLSNTISEIDDLFAQVIEEYLRQPTGGGVGVGGGGVGGIAPNRLPGNVDAVVTPIVPEIQTAPAFSDVSGHWAEKHIAALSARGVIHGYDDKTFRPDNTITRAEFTHILCNLIGIQSTEACSLADVSPTAWYYKSVCGAFREGIVTGYENRFEPDRFITREDAAVIISRVLKSNNTKEADFADVQSIADYALHAVVSLSEVGVIKGYPDRTFRPKSHISRAEVTSMVMRASELLGK